MQLYHQGNLKQHKQGVTLEWDEYAITAIKSVISPLVTCLDYISNRSSEDKPTIKGYRWSGQQIEYVLKRDDGLLLS